MTTDSCQAVTRYYSPNSSPFSGTFAFSCTSPSFCPYLVWQGGTGKCCPFTNALVCLDGSCRSDTNCPAVVSSKAPVVAPTSIIVTPTPTPTPTPAQVSSAANTPIAIVASPAASSVSGTTTCSGGLVCGNYWFCSTDNPPQCCPKQGQSLCSGASTCFSSSNGEQCCGNTICYAGQSCAPGGNACIGPSSSQPSSTTLTFSTLTSARSFSDIVPSPTATNGSDSDPLNILQTAVPKTAQDDPAGACFLNTKYHTYTTPAWYTEMPTPAQSYFASVNAQNTGACTGASSPPSGLSDGAKAGIGLGVLAGVAAFGALAFAFFKLGIIGSAAAASGSGAAGGGAAASQPPPVWSGQTGGEHAWNGMTGTDPLSQHPPMGYMPPVIVAGAAKRSSSSDQNRSSYIPYRPPVGHPAHSHYSNASAYSNYQQQAPPPRSVSPLESSSPTELYSNGANRRSEISGHGNTSPVHELSTSGAYPGHEIYSNERYEAPSAPDFDFPHSPHHGPEVQGYGGTQGHNQGYGQGY